MSAENHTEEKEMEFQPLEVPEVPAGAVSTDFPEIGDFLENMKIKGSLFGFQKEDVFLKMQQLDTMYQHRVHQMREQTRGQIKQIKKQQQEEQEEIRKHLKKEEEER
ncbi:MAG: hypothetical protein HFJ10_03440, partial [Lachnospiraceae bacterium]|nr:hypothetical protein [Lachnospiraceae bacterium]